MSYAWWYRPLFWVLLPLTIPQGLWLRRSATRLPGAAGERRGIAGDGPRLNLLAIGDSIIDGVGAGAITASLPVQFAAALSRQAGLKVLWRIEGTTGHGIRDVIGRLEMLDEPVPPDLVLVSVGVNDVTGLTSTRRWRRGVERLLALIQRRWPAARVLLAGLPPMSLFPLPPQPLRLSLGIRAATLDSIAAETCRAFSGAMHVPTRIDPRVHDFCADGFHPSPESCTLWARALCVELSTDWDPSTTRSTPT